MDAIQIDTITSCNGGDTIFRDRFAGHEARRWYDASRGSSERFSRGSTERIDYSASTLDGNKEEIQQFLPQVFKRLLDIMRHGD